MIPFANDGDYAVTTRIFIRIREGDVLVFKSPSDGTVLVKRVKELIFSNGIHEFFMEGDNRMRSVDSNKFGPIKKDSVIGKVLYILKK